jgi:pimeloyl-ACP methyl ester carboxylesterase
VGPDVGWTLRLLAAPGAELILPVIAPRPVLTAGNKLRSWFSAAGFSHPAVGCGAPIRLSDSDTRQAFLKTLRSVVDYRGQAVSALNRLHLTSELPTMVIWGDQDRIIPVEHGYAVHEARPGSRLEVLAGVGHFPHVERPSEVVDLFDDFISATSEIANEILDIPRTAPQPPAD